MHTRPHFQRGIVVPLDDAAESVMETGQLDRIASTIYFSFVDDSLFLLVSRSGLFGDLNRACGTQIEDSRNECITSEKLDAAITATRDLIEIVIDDDTRWILEQILGVFADAKRLGKSAHFIFKDNFRIPS